MPTLKDSDEEVESPLILGLGSVAFGDSSSSKKKKVQLNSPKVMDHHGAREQRARKSEILHMRWM
jgi:hypothetical protein